MKRKCGSASDEVEARQKCRQPSRPSRRTEGQKPGLAVEARDVEIVSQLGALAGLDDPDLIIAIVDMPGFLRVDEPVAASQPVQARDVGVLGRQSLPPAPGMDDDGALHVDAVAARPGLAVLFRHRTVEAAARLFLPEGIQKSHGSHLLYVFVYRLAIRMPFRENRLARAIIGCANLLQRNYKIRRAGAGFDIRHGAPNCKTGDSGQGIPIF